MTMQRRQLLTALALAGAIPRLRAQSLPETARLYAGFAAGGIVDVTARRIADKLREHYARTVVVENKTGAGGQLALSALKAAPGDGLTMAITPMSMLGIYPHTYKKLPYDSAVDFQPVSQVARFDFAFVVGPGVPTSVKTLADFVGWAKANPGAGFGSPAPGSVPHFIGELFSRSANVSLTHIPYRGSQPAIVDLLGGQLHAVSAPVGEFMPHLSSGKLRMLATAGSVRSKFAPGVPTYAEQGFREVVAEEWLGMYLPAKVPGDVVERLSVALRQALATKEVIDSLAQMGLEAKSSTPAELRALLARDSQRWGPVVKTIGFTADS